MEVCFPPVPVDGDRVPAFVIFKAYMQWLVDVADEMCQEHQALRQVIWYVYMNVQKTESLLFGLLD